MLRRYTLATARVSALLAAVFLVGCSTQNVVNPRLDDEMPRKILWAWERPEDLRFIDPNEFGVAFLAQTIFLASDRVISKPRRQPLELAPKTYLIAVTRIETNKDDGKRPTFDDEMAAKTVSLIKDTLDLPDVRAIQVDFDAVVSEREFYRRLMKKLAGILTGGNASVNERATTPVDGTLPDGRVSVRVPLTMTSLASWCTGDAWFNDFPVDEAVPMVFQMGADSEKIKTYLRGRNDWQEPLCRGSYGISLDEARFEGMKEGRRMYFFKNTAWNSADLTSGKALL